MTDLIDAQRQEAVERALVTPASSERREAIAREWRCFHCDEVFVSERCARLHFGHDEGSEPACQIKAGAEGSLVHALRDAETAADDAIQAMQNETTDASRAYHAQRCRHNQALIAAEELGYERGLTDGRTLPDDRDEQIARLTGERDRLRAALTDLANAARSLLSRGGEPGSHWSKLDDAHAASRAALGDAA